MFIGSEIGLVVSLLLEQLKDEGGKERKRKKSQLFHAFQFGGASMTNSEATGVSLWNGVKNVNGKYRTWFTFNGSWIEYFQILPTKLGIVLEVKLFDGCSLKTRHRRIFWMQSLLSVQLEELQLTGGYNNEPGKGNLYILDSIYWRFIHDILPPDRDFGSSFIEYTIPSKSSLFRLNFGLYQIHSVLLYFTFVSYDWNSNWRSFGSYENINQRSVRNYGQSGILYIFCNFSL